jgi:hypothetical protein
MSRNRILFGVRGLEVAEVLTDPEGASPMTFDTAHEVVGVNSVEVTLNQELQILRGDDVKLAGVSSPTDVSFSFQVAKTNLAVMAILSGGTFACGTSVTTLTLTGATSGSYFQAVFTSHDDEDNTCIITSNKTKASTINSTMADQAFAQPTWQAEVFKPRGTATDMFTIEWPTI